MDSNREKRKLEERRKAEALEASRKLRKLVVQILEKKEDDLSVHELQVLEENNDLACNVRAAMAKRANDRTVQRDRKQEKEDTPADMERKLQHLASLVLEAAAKGGGGVVVHTGAGLSTSAGIPDFRGPRGVWTLQAKKGQSAQMEKRYEDCHPTPAHHAIAALVRAGIIKHVITQNVDGLHGRSGLSREAVSELHGSVYVERCSACARRYLRDYDVTHPQGTSFRRHRTGRTCQRQVAEGRAATTDEPWDRPVKQEERREGVGGTESGDQREEAVVQVGDRGGGSGIKFCGGDLVDTIVHFGESLDGEVLAAAREACRGSGLAICLGTTLKVPPASTLPRLSRRQVIVNLQWTAQDRRAELKIHCRCDDAMCRLAAILGIQVEACAGGDPDPGRKILEKVQDLLPDVGKATGGAENKQKRAKERKVSFPRPNLPKATLKP